MGAINQFYLDVMVDLIEAGDSVLDLGCGDGEVLAYLREQKKVRGYGVDIDFHHVLSCMKKGLSAFHGDLDEGLQEFSDKSYDAVILSQTLQQVKKPELVMKEMLRVGKRVIVTFPNFAYWRSRLQILLGRTPVHSSLPYQWHNTPNIRSLTVLDFRDFCSELGIHIVQEVPYFESPILRAVAPRFLSNLLASSTLFVLEN